jgi:hypothetical protein
MAVKRGIANRPLHLQQVALSKHSRAETVALYLVHSDPGRCMLGPGCPARFEQPVSQVTGPQLGTAPSERVGQADLNHRPLLKLEDDVRPAPLEVPVTIDGRELDPVAGG